MRPWSIRRSSPAAITGARILATISTSTSSPTSPATSPRRPSRSPSTAASPSRSCGCSAPQHFDHYEFLLALTDELGGIGLEHLRSSENSQGARLFHRLGLGLGRPRPARPRIHPQLERQISPPGATCGRPITTCRCATACSGSMRARPNSGAIVLAARSGLMPAEDVLAEFARTAAFYDTLPGRAWRPLIDTTNDPIVQSRRPQPWSSWMRGEDYYSEGMLIWLEVDARLRQLTGGRRSMNDFARAFFGVNPGDQGVATYTFDDVVRTLNAIAPFDWGSYLRERVDARRAAGAARLDRGRRLPARLPRHADALLHVAREGPEDPRPHLFDRRGDRRRRAGSAASPGIRRCSTPARPRARPSSRSTAGNIRTTPSASAITAAHDRPRPDPPPDQARRALQRGRHRLS